MSDTSIRPCSCSHKMQDSLYGVGNRVHNKGLSKSAGQKWRCTVCGRVKE